MSGAWALVMLHDRQRGRDFVDEGFELRHSMFPEFTPRLVDRYIERFSDGFDSIDLRRYSKARNPQLKSYTFGFANCWRGSP